MSRLGGNDETWLQLQNALNVWPHRSGRESLANGKLP